MSIKLPLNSNWTQPNNSNKFGSLWATKNINLDSEGYIKLSPRSINLFDDTENTTNISDTNFNVPVAFGRTQSGIFNIATVEDPFNFSFGNLTKTIAEDTAGSNPDLALNSHGIWWQNRYHESGSTFVSYKSGSTWTANAITSLNSSYRHWLAVFKNKNTFCVSNGNVVKQYDTSYSGTTDLTLPSDFEVIGMAYNNNKMGIITRLGSDAASQNADAYFFWWDGATTTANFGTPIGSHTCIAIKAYKSSFIILTSSGEILFFNGGGFETLTSFPFYFEENRIDDLVNFASYGDIMIVDGDVIYINMAFSLSQVGRKAEDYLVNNPHGVWCYDPKVGLYHKYSASQSRGYFHTISAANVNTSTDLFTTSITIPATGNPVILTSGTVGGITKGTVYFVIKVSSTTFRLAETKELANVGVYIDITSSSANQYFLMCDVIDYGSSFDVITGAVTIYENSTNVFRDILFGGRYDDNTLTSVNTLCSSTPFFESRGYFIIPKIYPNKVEDTIQKLFVKFRPLDTDDKIVVYSKDKYVFGLTTTVTSETDAFIWTGKNSGYTTARLAEAKTFLDNGGDIQIEFLSGVGAGQMTQVTAINYDADSLTYSFELEDDVVGAVSDLKSTFLVDNWKKEKVIDNTDNNKGYSEILIGSKAPSYQFKIELRGYETTIEDIEIVTQTYKDSK